MPLSKALATVKTDCELPLQAHEIKLAAPDVEVLKMLYQRYGFRTALSELGGADAVPPESQSNVQTIEKRYSLIQTQAQFDEWLARLYAAAEFAFDTETTGINPLRAELVGISFATEPGLAAYLPLGHRNALGAPPEQLLLADVLAALKPLLEDSSKGKIGHHGKYDAHILRRYGVNLAGYKHDSMLASYVFNATATLHNMDSVAKTYLNYSTIKYEDVAGKGAKQISFADVALADALNYAAEDADITLRLKQTLRFFCHWLPAASTPPVAQAFQPA